MATLLQITSATDGTGPVPPPRGMALFRLGFRPFYLAAAVAAVVLMGLWHAVGTGQLVLASGLAPVLWHAHELIFGVFVAIVVGFLFTAGQVWTGRPTPRGASLAAFVALWLAARLAAVVAPYAVYAALDAAFLPLAATVFVALLVRGRNRRNLVVAAVLVLLAAANVAFHLAASGIVPMPAMAPLHAGLALLIVLETIIGGRVIPMFTANATPGLRIAPAPGIERAVLATTAAGLGAWVFGTPAWASSPLLFAAAALHARRMAAWAPARALGRPLLAILHLSYAWIPVGLALLALALARGDTVSPAVHALAVGATAGLVLGMMTRTARGHTGRPLTASRLEVTAYAMVMLAAIARVAAPWFDRTGYLTALVVAGSLWMGAFALYVVRYAPWLARARIDGRDG